MTVRFPLLQFLGASRLTPARSLHSWLFFRACLAIRPKIAPPPRHPAHLIPVPGAVEAGQEAADQRGKGWGEAEPRPVAQHPRRGAYLGQGQGAARLLYAHVICGSMCMLWGQGQGGCPGCTLRSTIFGSAWVLWS